MLEIEPYCNFMLVAIVRFESSCVWRREKIKLGNWFGLESAITMSINSTSLKLNDLHLLNLISCFFVVHIQIQLQLTYRIVIKTLLDVSWNVLQHLFPIVSFPECSECHWSTIEYYILASIIVIEQWVFVWMLPIFLPSQLYKNTELNQYNQQPVMCHHNIYT